MKNNSYQEMFQVMFIALLSIGLLTAGIRFLVTSNTLFGADFYIYWQAGRALFLHNLNPYAFATTQQIQLGIYHRLAAAGEDQLRYAYPPFGLLAILPAVAMAYPWAQAYWIAFNLVVMILAVRSIKKKPSLWLLAGLVFFYPISRGLILGQFALLLGAILIFSYGLLHQQDSPSSRRQWLVGGLLAWCAMKPQITGLILLFFLLEALRKRQWRIITGAAAGELLLGIISWVLVPSWISDWTQLIFAYVNYVPIQPIIGSWLSFIGLSLSAVWLKVLLIIVAFIITLLVLGLWWKKRLPNILVLGWLILLSQLVNPNPNSLLSDQIVFLLPLLIWLTDDAIKNWVRVIIWGGFVLVPWLLFGIYFQGKEPYAVASGLALLFFIWLISIFIAWISQQRTSKFLGGFISGTEERKVSIE
jgi:hypothetical protein